MWVSRVATLVMFSAPWAQGRGVRDCVQGCVRPVCGVWVARVVSPRYVFGTLGTKTGRVRLRVGLSEACVRGARGACGAPRYVFGAFGARSGRARLCVGLCEACVRGIGGACGDPCDVFGTLGTRPGCSRLCAGLCEARVRGVGGACGDPCDVFGALGMRPGCSRLCAGLCEACVRGRCSPSLCVRRPRHEAGVFEIVCRVM